MKEMENIGSVGAGASQGGNLGAAMGEMSGGIQGVANTKASSIARMNSPMMQNASNQSASIEGGSNNTVVQITNQTNISQTLEISIMNEYHSSGIKSSKFEELFENLLREGADIEVLKKVLEALQQKKLEELIELLILLLGGSESGGLVNMQG